MNRSMNRFFFLLFYLSYSFFILAEDSSAFNTNLNSNEDDKLLGEKSQLYNSSQIFILNKITSKLYNISLNVDETISFDNLEISLERCFQDNNPYKKSIWIFTTIKENMDNEKNTIFQDWLNSDSISLNIFQHPIYNIFVQKCYNEELKKLSIQSSK